MERWIPVSTINATIEGFVALELDREALLRSCDLDSSVLENPFAAVPQAVFEQLWRRAAEADGEPLFFVRAGRAVPFGAFGLFDHLVSSATTVGEGFETLAHYFRLVTSSQSLSIENRGAETRILLEHRFPDLDLRIAELWCWSLLIARFEQALEPDPFEVLELWSTLPEAPGPIEDYRRFFDIPIRFAAPHCMLRLDRSTWKRPIPRASASLHRALEDVANRVEVKKFAAGPVAFAVRARLEPDAHAFDFDADRMAAELGMSRRTLQRRLAEEGHRYRDLVDRIRRSRAEKLLRESRLPIGEIATRLGYGEQSSFNRAFRRWTGRSPRSFRERPVLEQPTSIDRRGSTTELEMPQERS